MHGDTVLMFNYYFDIFYGLPPIIAVSMVNYSHGALSLLLALCFQLREFALIVPFI